MPDSQQNTEKTDVAYIVTGAAGFIGAEVCIRLLEQGHTVVGIDNINDYYDTRLKKDRLSRVEAFENFSFTKCDISDSSALNAVFENTREKFEDIILIHLAAQAGVRYSIENPGAYVQSNLVGFANILECARNYKVKHLVYASSSSVYGANKKIPFSEADSVDYPVSLYASTKKSNELLAHSYAHLYDIPVTGLRFFTVYGPWGRPDMAYFIFTKAILNNEPINVFNNGDMRRDFTYIDDIVTGVINVANKPPQKQTQFQRIASGELVETSSQAPYKIYNIGNNQPEPLMLLVDTLQSLLNKKAVLNYKPMMMGDVKETYADLDALNQDFGFKPETSLQNGLEKFVRWYQSYYKI